MALRAGYHGIKKFIADKLNRMNPDDSFATDAEIATAVEAAVEEVTDLIEDTVGWVGGNLVTELQQGTVNPDGSESPNAARVRTGYIPVVVGVTYTVSGTVPDKTVELLLYRYNSNKQLISQTADWVDSGYSEKVTVASYIRVVLRTSDGSNITPSSFTSVDFTAESVEDKKVDISALGTQEGATASRLYHPGEYFYKGGQSCEVIGNADIAQGATWTLNTNYKVKSIYTALQDVGGCYDYSTTEFNTGSKWIDGKDIYCKVVTGETLPVTGTTLIENVETLVNCYGTQKYNDTLSRYYTFPYGDLRPEVVESTHVLRILVSGVTNTTDYEWVFLYTKYTVQSTKKKRRI